jgi:hypothetical protein
MPLPLLAMLAIQAAATGASAYSANRAKKKNEAAMKDAANRASSFQPKELGKTLKGQYFESLLSDKDLSESQKQEAQDLLRSQADTDYGISDYAPSGFAALGAQAAGTAKTQDALGRLGSKYAPMHLAMKQRADQLAQGVEQSDYLNEQARRDKEQTLINLSLGRAMAENQNRNQMNQLAIGLGASMANTLGGVSKEDFNNLFTGKNNQALLDAKLANVTPTATGFNTASMSRVPFKNWRNPLPTIDQPLPGSVPLNKPNPFIAPQPNPYAPGPLPKTFYNPYNMYGNNSQTNTQTDYTKGIKFNPIVGFNGF